MWFTMMVQLSMLTTNARTIRDEKEVEGAREGEGSGERVRGGGRGEGRERGREKVT